MGEPFHYQLLRTPLAAARRIKIHLIIICGYSLIVAYMPQIAVVRDTIARSSYVIIR